MNPSVSSRVRTFVVHVVTFALLAMAAVPVGAQRRETRHTTHTSINQNRNVNTNLNRNTNVNANRNVNVNQHTNVNVNRNTNVNVNRNVNVNHGYYYNSGPSVAGVVAATVVTAVVVGAVVSSLPPNCTTLVANGIAYQNCGGHYYQPQYQGSSVTYVVVNHP
jgi:hypothetical protein